MLKRMITYTNPFTEEEVTEEHYFHISKADLVEMEMEEHGARYMKDGEELTGMQAKLQKIVDSEDGKAIMREFRDIIRRAYGKKDGDRFVKSQAAWADFEASEAFSQLLFELCTDAAGSAEFVNGIIPGNLEQIAAEVKQEAAQATTPEQREDQIASNQTEMRERGIEPLKGDTLAERIAAATSQNPLELTNADLADIDSDELKSGLATGRLKLGLPSGHTAV